jgi:hypothetical protein
MTVDKLPLRAEGDDADLSDRRLDVTAMQQVAGGGPRDC